MSLIGVGTPFLIPCDDAGGAIVPHSPLSLLLVPTWKDGTYQKGQLVKAEVPANSGNWVIYLATGDHVLGHASPATGAAGWLAISASPTQIPKWQANQSYVAGAPVRIDHLGTGLSTTKQYIATVPITNSTHSPDTQGGRNDGWIEVRPDPAPPAPTYSRTVTYEIGDLVWHQHHLYRASKNMAAGAGDPDSAAGITAGWEPVHPKNTRFETFVQGEPYRRGDVVWFQGHAYYANQLIAGSVNTPASPAGIASGWLPFHPASSGQHIYVGAGLWDNRNVNPPLYGMPAGTLPDPATVEPQPSDVYIDTLSGSVTIFG